VTGVGSPKSTRLIPVKHEVAPLITDNGATGEHSIEFLSYEPRLSASLVALGPRSFFQVSIENK
jgi:hypothetical protein